MEKRLATAAHSSPRSLQGGEPPSLGRPPPRTERLARAATADGAPNTVCRRTFSFFLFLDGVITHQSPDNLTD